MKSPFFLQLARTSLQPVRLAWFVLASFMFSCCLIAQEVAVEVVVDGVEVFAPASEAPQEPENKAALPTKPRLRLKNGDFVDGEPVAIDSTDSLGWTSAHFNAPLRFAIEQIRGFELSQDTTAIKAAEPWTLELHSGDRVTGSLLSWKEGKVSFTSPTFGELALGSDLVSRLVKNSNDVQWIFQGPRDPSAWKPFSGDEAWKMQGGSLVSSQIGSRTIGNVGLPEKASIDLRLSWEGKAGFVIALGVDDNASNINNSFRIETWQSQLVLVRQAKGKAEIIELETLDPNQSVLELTLFFDQKTERVVVYSGYGKLLADLTLASGDAKVLSSVAIANHTENLRVDRFRVREWTMQLPADRQTGENYVIKHAVEPLTCNVISADPAEGWKLKTTDGELVVAWDELTEIIQMDEANSRDNQTAASMPPVENQREGSEKKDDAFADLFESIKEGENVLKESTPATTSSQKKTTSVVETGIQLEFFDGARWRGDWTAMANGVVSFSPKSTGTTIQFPLSSVMSFRGTSKTPAAPTGNFASGRKGAFMGDDIQLEGILVTANEKAVLGWQALAAQEPVGIIVTDNARLDFRGRARRQQSLSDSKAAQQVQVQMAFGGMGEEQKAAEPSFELRQLMVPSITLRNGDAFAAQLQAVSEEGIQFKSDKIESGKLSNEVVQSIELRKLRSSKIPSAKKVERLLTVPRSAKNDPPTHVLISVEGDFLRGRLVDINSDFATMEIRLEQVIVPLEKVAQIVWLHERNWKVGETGEKPASETAGGDKSQNELPNANDTAAQPGETKTADATTESLPHGSVVAMFRNGLRMSFAPTSVNEQMILGTNPTLGKCTLAVSEIDLILLGPKANTQAADLASNPWKLNLAKSPLESTDEEGGGGGVGEQSTLVGQPAPEIELETASGDKFKLSELKGKIVVLDFWASWCGPCMQTMPEVDKIIAEFPADQVELIAVNLEEPADRAKAAMDRLKLHTKVVLDIDGVAAQKYQANAIPQTVIIDRDGKVLNVFVGGGQQFLNNFREAVNKAINGLTDIQ